MYVSGLRRLLPFDADACFPAGAAYHSSTRFLLFWIHSNGYVSTGAGVNRAHKRSLGDAKEDPAARRTHIMLLSLRCCCEKSEQTNERS